MPWAMRLPGKWAAGRRTRSLRGLSALPIRRTGGDGRSTPTRYCSRRQLSPRLPRLREVRLAAGPLRRYAVPVVRNDTWPALRRMTNADVLMPRPKEHFDCRELERPPAGPPNILECQACGWEPPDQIIPPRRCPHCFSHRFVRYPRPGAMIVRELTSAR
jgi:hypothetical protein